MRNFGLLELLSLQFQTISGESLAPAGKSDRPVSEKTMLGAVLLKTELWQIAICKRQYVFNFNTALSCYILHKTVYLLRVPIIICVPTC